MSLRRARTLGSIAAVAVAVAACASSGYTLACADGSEGMARTECQEVADAIVERVGLETAALGALRGITIEGLDCGEAARERPNAEQELTAAVECWRAELTYPGGPVSLIAARDVEGGAIGLYE